MRKSVSAVDMKWLSNRADTLLLAHLTPDFPIPTSILSAGLTSQAAATLQQRYPKANVSILAVAEVKKAVFPVANHSIDLFIANLLIEHKVELANLFAEVERVLSTEGVVLFTTNDSHTKIMLEKYAKTMSADLVDENNTTEQLEKRDVMQFFFRRHHILSIKQPRQFIDCDVFIASAAFSPQFIRKLLEQQIRIDEVELQATSAVMENELIEEEKHEKEEEPEKPEDEEEQEKMENEREPSEQEGAEIEAPEHEEEAEEELGEEKETESEGVEAEEVEKAETETEEPERQEENETAEETDEEQEVPEHEAESEPERESEHEEEASEENDEEETENKEAEESKEAEEDEVEDEDEEDEVEDEDEEEPLEHTEVETEKAAHETEPAENKEEVENSHYHELHSLSGLIHENEKALQEHETVMTKELHNTVRVLSKSQLLQSNPEAKQKQTKQLQQHEKKLDNYRELTNKHKELIGNFLEVHTRVLENQADPGRQFQQLLSRQHNIIEHHDANIEQHAAFLKAKKEG